MGRETPRGAPGSVYIGLPAQCWGDRSVGKVLAMQAQGPEFPWGSWEMLGMAACIGNHSTGEAEAC